MEDVAQKVTKRLYGNDKVKFGIILTLFYYTQKFGEDIRYYSEGNLDEYIKGFIEFLEDNINLKELDHKLVREYDMLISEWKKIRNCLENVNMFYLEDIEKMDKNQVKNGFKRVVKHMNS